MKRTTVDESAAAEAGASGDGWGSFTLLILPSIFVYLLVRVIAATLSRGGPKNRNGNSELTENLSPAFPP